MRKTGFIFVLFFSIFQSLTTFGQGSFTFKVKVVNNDGSAVKNLPIILKETNTHQKITFTTNSSGEVTIALNEGMVWWMSVGKMYNFRQLEVPDRGSASGSQLITYDLPRWERENRQMPDRSKITFTVVEQQIKSSQKPTPAFSLVELVVSKADKTPLKNFPVSFTCLKTKTEYKAKTDFAGIARFFVPVNDDYEIDIDGIESYKYMDLGTQASIETYRFTYEPTDIKETIKGDTVFQYLTEDTKPSSARFLHKITVKDSDGNLISGETVYLNNTRSNKVYVSKTNNDGVAVFMIPVRNKYMINFEFRKDIDVVNLMYIKGIGQGSMNFVYRPDPKLQFPEKYIPTAEELMLKEFNNYLIKQFPKSESGKPIHMIVEWGSDVINGKSKEAVLNIGFSITNDQNSAYGPPVNISLVMDKSGSMEGYNRIEELKTALISFVSTLRPNDIASLIVFESEPELVLESGKIESRKQEFIDNINMIEAGGGTNIYKGMILGYEQVLKNYIPGGTNRVLLLTDGYGETPVDTIIGKSKEYNKKGVQLSAIGVGYDYNQALLRLLATDGSGIFQQADSSYNLNNTFKTEISSLIYPVAKDVTVEIEYNNMIVFKHLYGFEFEQKEKNKAILSMDNVYPGLNKLAIVKFDLDKPSKEIEKLPVILRMNYFDLKSNTKETIEEKAYLKWTDEIGKYELIMDSEYKKLYAIAIMNQSLKVMADAFGKNDFAKAQSSIDSAIQQLKSLYPDSKQKDVEELYRKLKDYNNILTQYKKNIYKRNAN